MKNNNPIRSSILTTSLAIVLAVSFIGATPNLASAAGGGGGGGSSSVKVVLARVTGYVTAIDYIKGTITIGASYYGSGALKVDASTSISLDNATCSLDDVKIGDWMEARYDFASKVAAKLTGTSVPTS